MLQRLATVFVNSPIRGCDNPHDELDFAARSIFTPIFTDRCHLATFPPPGAESEYPGRIDTTSELGSASLRIVIAREAGPDGKSQDFCVYSGWLCELSGNGVPFVYSERLSRWELFLKIRCRDSCIRFEVAGIPEESPTSSGLRCYSASFTVRDIVDRYEFD